jgi:hypothetical protein
VRSDYLECCSDKMKIVDVKILTTGMTVEMSCERCHKHRIISVKCEFDMTRSKIRIGRYSIKYQTAA